eukprot:3884862-Pleurochrysis_carterae.AAC.1
MNGIRIRAGKRRDRISRVFFDDLRADGAVYLLLPRVVVHRVEDDRGHGKGAEKSEKKRKGRGRATLIWG